SDYFCQSAIRNPKSAIVNSSFADFSLHDPRVAQIEPIAGVQISAVVHQDLQAFYVCDIQLNGVSWLVAGDLSIEKHSVVARDYESHVAGSAGGRINAGGCNESLKTGRQMVDNFRAATQREPFVERLR